MQGSGFEHNTELASGYARQKRIVALDGLRGLAALIVVIFHFLYMLIPTAVSTFDQTPFVLTDTPLGILWNGRFAVSVFFVLSGFVIAGAAERRSNQIISNIVTRYVRLALPATASVIFAWLLLTTFPTATEDLAKVTDSPSHWLNHTHQALIPPFHEALTHGLVGNFVAGGSLFNNVLWTMKIELIGSISLFIIYWLTSGRARLIVLTICGLAIPFIMRPDYFGFVLGALMYEARTRGFLNNVPTWLTTTLFFAGLVLGAPGEGFSQRWDLPTIIPLITIGNSNGITPIIAATLLIFAIANSPTIADFFSSSYLQWLGKISFALYLVHVPILYTLVATVYVDLQPNFLVIIIGYFGSVLLLAHIFTKMVDEPTLKLFPAIKAYLSPIDKLSNLRRS